MISMLKKPDLVHHVLPVVTDFVRKKADCWIDRFGGERLMVLDLGIETNKLISPKQFGIFSLPYLQRINQVCFDLGIGTYFIHIRGEQNKNLRFWQQVPVTKQTAISVGREMDLTTTMEMIPEQIAAGNVDPTLFQ